MSLSFLFLSPFLIKSPSISPLVFESPPFDQSLPHQNPIALYPAHLSSTSTSTMADHHDDDLTASKTEGFKVGEKKTLQEYQELGEFRIAIVNQCSPSLFTDTSPPPPQTRTTRPSTAGRPLWASTPATQSANPATRSVSSSHCP